jgi:hypothetical protein
MCDDGKPQDHARAHVGSRRDFLKASTATAAATGLSLLHASSASAKNDNDPGPPEDSGKPGRRYLIRGGSVMSMDPVVGNFAQADVLIEGKKIVAIQPNIKAPGAKVIDARGRIVMPGFIDTHHHQFETVLRSFLADGVPINDQSGSPSGSTTYFEYILLTFAPVFRAQDVYINELFAGLSQLDDGVTTVHDVSQIHHSPQHSDAAIRRCSTPDVAPLSAYFERGCCDSRHQSRQQVSGRRGAHQGSSGSRQAISSSR